MTTILLCLVLYGLLMFAAGLRCAVVLRERRADRRSGYLPINGSYVDVDVRGNDAFGL